VVDEEMMMPGRSLVRVSAVCCLHCFDANHSWQEGRLTCKNPISLICRGSLLKQVEEKDPRENQVTPVHLEKWPLNWEKW